VDHPQGDEPTIAVIIAGGDPVTAAELDRIPQQALVIAADSGLDEAERLGVAVDIVVGDLDSATPDAVARARAASAAIEQYPVDKDATDLALALARARALGCRRAILFGGHGGRLSHLLGNALALTAPSLAPMEVEWHVNGATVWVVRAGGTAHVAGAPGDLVSLLATGGPITGVTTAGLRWALDGDTLDPGSTRGISNEMTTPTASVSLGTGVALVVHERITV
jgi:thiamine pyrophosphokinase